MFIISLKYKVSSEKIDEKLDEHIQFLDKYYNKKIFMASGRKVPRTGGVILAKAESPKDIEEIIKDDPFYQNDLANYEITEFVPSKVDPDLENYLAN